MEEDEFTFIEEQVKHKKSNKVISVIKKLGITVIMAAVFGAISALSFYFIYGSLTKKENKAPMPSYAVNDAEEDLKDRVTQPPQVKEPDAKDGGDRLAAFARKYSNVASFCEAQKDMLVVVSEIEDGIDYFETPVESVTSSIGLILSKNNQSIYVLTEGSSMGEGTSYEITMKDGTKLGAVYHAADTATGLMVLSADISGISAENRKSIKTAKIGTSSDIRKGNMVFAIGAPQSDMYSISYGYVCSDATKKYLPDRSVSVFNTNMNFTANASGGKK